MHLNQKFIPILTVLGSLSAVAQTPTSTASPPKMPSAGSNTTYKAPALPSSGTSTLLSAPPNPAGALAASAAGALAFLSPSIRYGVQYGDAVSSPVGDQKKSYIHQLSPTLTARFAEQWSLSYTPSFIWYSSDAFEDRINHIANLEGNGAMGNVSIALNQSYLRTSDSLVETGQQTKQEVWGTSASAISPYGDKSQLEATISQQIRNTDLFSDIRSWNGMAWLRRDFDSGVSLGAGGGLGYTISDPGLNYETQQLKGSVRFGQNSRLSADFNGGIDFNRFSNGAGGTRVSPAYKLDLRYQIAAPTSVTVSASQATESSYYFNQFTRQRQLSVSLSQRLFERFFLTLAGTRAKVTYVQATLPGEGAPRLDTITTLRATLGTQLFRRFSVNASWQNTRNRSNDRLFSLDSTMVGLDIGWSF